MEISRCTEHRNRGSLGQKTVSVWHSWSAGTPGQAGLQPSGEASLEASVRKHLFSYMRVHVLYHILNAQFGILAFVFCILKLQYYV